MRLLEEVLYFLQFFYIDLDFVQIIFTLNGHGIKGYLANVAIGQPGGQTIDRPADQLNCFEKKQTIRFSFGYVYIISEQNTNVNI